MEVGGGLNAPFIGLVLSFLLHTCAAHGEGVASLSSDVFDKVIPKHEAVLVKFDHGYPDAHDDFDQTQPPKPEKRRRDEFSKVAKMAMGQKDLLIADVHLSDYGKTNWDLAKRYNVRHEDCPVLLLFLKGRKDPITYTGSLEDADQIIEFVVSNAEVWLGFPGSLKHFDNLVTEFLDAKGDDRNAVIGKAEEATKSLTEDEDKESADIYIKTMKTIAERGDDFIQKEKERVRFMKMGKLSDKKKEFLQKRFGILSSFNVRIRDEL